MTKAGSRFRTLSEASSRAHGTELFVTSLTGEYVRIYPMPVWSALEEKLVARADDEPRAAEVPGPRELFRSDRGVRRPGTRPDSPAAARVGRDERRGRRVRPVRLSGRLEPRTLRREAAARTATRTTTRGRCRSSESDGPLAHARAGDGGRDRRVARCRREAACSWTAPWGSEVTRACCSRPAPRACSASIATRRRSRWPPPRWRPVADRVELVHADYRELGAILDARGLDRVDGVLADLGVSSMQFDTEGRGFSFRRDEPLDMRMDQTQGQTAADLLAAAGEEDLANVIFQYGEERFSRRIARRIVEARQAAAIATTGQLAAHRPQRGPAQGLPADRPGDADVPGAAHLGQPRARGARRASCWRRRGGCAPGRGSR